MFGPFVLVAGLVAGTAVWSLWVLVEQAAMTVGPAVAALVGAVLAVVLSRIVLVREESSSVSWGSLRATLVAAAIALPSAAVLVIAGVAFVVLVEAPQGGVLAASWRVLVVDRGAWLTLAGVVAALTYARRPVSSTALEHWLRRRALPDEVATEAGRELRRVRTLRTVPAALGACIGLGAGHAYNLALEVAGPAAPATVALGDAATGTGAYHWGGWLLAGYFLGALVAEATRRAPVSTAAASARLLPRRPASYLTRPARVLPPAAAALLAFGVSAWGVASPEQVTGPGPDARVAAVVFVVLAVVVPAAQWWIITRPQRQSSAASRALDDTFRSSAVHALVGSSIAAGLAVLADVLGGLWSIWVDAGVPAFWLVAMLPVAVALFAGFYAVWLHYGTSHPGRRPDSEASQR